MNVTVEAIVLAAGKSTRMKAPIPKQFLPLAGKPLMVHVLETMESLDEVSRVYLTCLAEEEGTYRRVLTDYGLTKVTLVRGGQTRQESVYNALQHVTSKRVLIHVANRPFVPAAYIRNLLTVEGSAVVPVLPIPFNVAVGDQRMERPLERASLRNIQLPQVFETTLLKQAHETFKDQMGRFTEDSAMLFELGHEVIFVPGLEENIKLTTPLDYAIGAFLMQELHKGQARADSQTG